MRVSFTTREFVSADEEGQQQMLAAASAALRSEPNGEIKELEAKLRLYEDKFDIPSDEIRSMVSNGALRETWEVCEWLMVLKLKERLERRRSS